MQPSTCKNTLQVCKITHWARHEVGETANVSKNHQLHSYWRGKSFEIWKRTLTQPDKTCASGLTGRGTSFPISTHSLPPQTCERQHTLNWTGPTGTLFFWFQGVAFISFISDITLTECMKEIVQKWHCNREWCCRVRKGASLTQRVEVIFHSKIKKNEKIFLA